MTLDALAFEQRKGTSLLWLAGGCYTTKASNSGAWTWWPFRDIGPDEVFIPMRHFRSGPVTLNELAFLVPEVWGGRQ